MNLLIVYRDRLWSHTAAKVEPTEKFYTFRQTMIYWLTSVKTDANSRLIINVGNDPSKVGKLGADGNICPALCQQISLVR